MRIAVSSESDNGLASPVGAHFGRCPFFTIIEVEGTDIKQVSSIDNPFFLNHSPGEVPSYIQQQQANVMLAGGMGRRAVQIFEQLGIKAVTGAQGTVQHALEQYLGGALKGVAPCAESEAHHQAGLHE